jgi:hypothetical protein
VTRRTVRSGRAAMAPAFGEGAKRRLPNVKLLRAELRGLHVKHRRWARGARQRRRGGKAGGLGHGMGVVGMSVDGNEKS